MVSDPPSGVMDLTGYAEVLEAFRSPALRTLVEPGTGSLRSGTVLRIEGGDHTRRRRTLNRLTSRDGATWFRDHHLVPLVATELDDLKRDSAAPVAFDLVEFGNRLFLRLAWSQIGLAPIESAGELDEVRKLVAELELAYLGAGTPQEREAMIRRGLAAKDAFGRRYFAPELAARANLVAAVTRGERNESELPRDLLTLLASHADPEWADAELALREAVTDILFAGTANSVHSMVHAVDELFRWLAAHPEDRPLVTDPTFLARAVGEALRVHVINTAFYRLATEDVELTGGVRIPAGTTVRLGIRTANLDPAVFGADAGVFNPRRELPPGAYPYGLAFGSGVHMCYGLNVVLGPDQVSGTHPHVLRELFQSGIAANPDRPPRRPAGSDRDVFESYPVLLKS
jgi:cytochrome P450